MATTTTTNVENVASGTVSGPSAEKVRLRAMALAAQLRVHGLADRASKASEDSTEGPKEAVRYAVIAGRAAVAAFKLAE